MKKTSFRSHFTPASSDAAIVAQEAHSIPASQANEDIRSILTRQITTMDEYWADQQVLFAAGTVIWIRLKKGNITHGTYSACR